MEVQTSLLVRRAARDARSRPWLSGSTVGKCVRQSSDRDVRSSTAMEASRIVKKVATNAQLERAYSCRVPATVPGLGGGFGDSCAEPKSNPVTNVAPIVESSEVTEGTTEAKLDNLDPDWSGMSRAGRAMFEHLPGARPEMSLEQLAGLQRAFARAEGEFRDLVSEEGDSSSETGSDSDASSACSVSSGSSTRTSSIPRLKQGYRSNVSSFSGRLAPPSGARGSCIPVAKLYGLMATAKDKLRSVISGGLFGGRTQRMKASTQASCLRRSDLGPQRPKKKVRFQGRTEIWILPSARPKDPFFSGCCPAGAGEDSLCDSCLVQGKSDCELPSLVQWWESQSSLRLDSGLEPLDIETVAEEYR